MSTVRLEALTIAGLIGGSASRQDRSPARSDASLCSVVDSIDSGGDGSSVPSDALDEIDFTDDEGDTLEARKGMQTAADRPEYSGYSSTRSSKRAASATSVTISRDDATTETHEILSSQADAILLPSRYARASGEASRPSSAAQQVVRPSSVNYSLSPKLSRRAATAAFARAKGDQMREVGVYRITSSEPVRTSPNPTHVRPRPASASAFSKSLGSDGDNRRSSRRCVPAPTITCKILVVGNAKCGKSSIISRYVSDRFTSDYVSTVGADYAMKDVTIGDGRQVRLQLWDIAGQDRFAKLTRAYFRQAKGAVVVCDVTREGTFDAIVRWKDEIDLWCENEDCELPVYLFANKCDLLTEVQDSFLAGARMEKTCREAGFTAWHITSAKRGDNIDEAMTTLLEVALEMNERRHRRNLEPVHVDRNSSCDPNIGAFRLSGGAGPERPRQGLCCA